MKTKGKITTHVVPFGPPNLCDWPGCLTPSEKLSDGNFLCGGHGHIISLAKSNNVNTIEWQSDSGKSTRMDLTAQIESVRRIAEIRQEVLWEVV